YEGLLESQREELHARAGGALEHAYADRLHEQYELLAYHYSHSADREKAAQYLTRANGKAASRHAMEEAIGYFYEALAVLESLPDTEANRRRRLALVFDQTWEFHWTHRHHEFHDLLLRHEPMVLELGDPTLLAQLYTQLGHRRLCFGDYEAALATAALTLEAAHASDSPEASILIANAHGSCSWAHMMRGDYDLSVSEHAESMRWFDGRSDSVW